MNLIQSNVKNYISEVLTKCHEKRITIYYWVLNLSVLFIFLTGVGILLYACYKQKPTKEELRKKMIMEQNYILEQIRFYQGQMKSSSEITDLPVLSETRDQIRYDPRI